MSINDIDTFWKTILSDLELSLSKAHFNTWLSHTSLLSKEEHRVVIAVPTPFVREWLQNKYHSLILETLQKHDPAIQDFSCIIENIPSNGSAPAIRGLDGVRRANTTPPTQSPEPHHQPIVVSQPTNSLSPIASQTTPFHPPITGNIPATPPPSLAHSPFPTSHHAKTPSNLNPRYTFENFIVGENNELARAACYAVSQNPGSLYNPLFIYGVVGVGKTHLLQSIGHEMLKLFPEKNVLYTTSERFTNELIESIRTQTVNTFKTSYQNIDLLLIDDVQFLSGREKTQQEFFHIFNHLYQLNKQIVITSDRPPKSIPTLEDRLKSRFEGGMIADVSRPDLETRMAILRLKITEKHFSLDEECIRFIAENITNNIRELEGALNRVIVSSEFQKVHPTIPYITKILGQIITTNKRTLSLETIAKTVANFYHIPEEALLGKGRKKDVAFARQVAMHLARTELTLSLSGVGKFFGGRDHTTVLHACERIQKESAVDPLRKEELIHLREQLYRE